MKSKIRKVSKSTFPARDLNEALTLLKRYQDVLSKLRWVMESDRTLEKTKLTVAGVVGGCQKLQEEIEAVNEALLTMASYSAVNATVDIARYGTMYACSKSTANWNAAIVVKRGVLAKNKKKLQS